MLTAPALTREAQAVLDAAVAWKTAPNFGHSRSLEDAVNAYRATLRTPEDELREAEAALLEAIRDPLSAEQDLRMAFARVLVARERVHSARPA